ncbi:hypothetical protein [Saccharopolyspora antimicrobica]|nr:hypothetical protein [Saccharopolyspora antimicrobica]
MRRLRSAGAASTAARLGVALVGVGLLVAGTVAVFATTNSAGSSALIAAGTVLVAVAVFTNRLESVEGAGVKIQLGAVAAKLQEADQADASGDAEAAEQLRREAQLLVVAMEPIATRYEAIRKSSPHGRRRTDALSELVEQARKMARFDFISTEAVEELFRSGQDGNRITALGLMLEDTRFASVPIITEVFRGPRSNFELWHALRVCLDVVRQDGQQAHYEAIREAISVARANGSLGGGSDRSRFRLAERIANAMERRENSDQGAR